MVQGPSGSQQYTPGQQAAAPPGQETITYAAYQPQTHTFVSQQHQPYPQVPAQEPVQAFSSMLMGTIERTIERVERGVLDNMRRLDTTHRDRQTILDNNVQELQKNILVSRDQAHEETRQVAKWIEASHAFHVKALCQVQERMDTLQRSVGTLSAPIALESEDSEQPAEKSLTERMDRIECLLYELLEKSNDPDASKPVVEMRDMGTSPHVEPEPVKVFLDVDTQTVTAAHHDAIVGPSVPPAVYADANTSPLEIEQTDFGVGPRTPEPEELDVAPPTTPRVKISELSIQARAYAPS
ncbi:hypothetical protein EUX98_g5833 [Antrodiella citrinella]|uniref:Uncharacterized protein n=1 Tax=Antrodiella citrinella TaxID=2447956 RepID=A0A4S4MSP0_9APHY|nr:hypothetical protein EUX98_g5833 [Antrodiella citrinella]